LEARQRRAARTRQGSRDGSGGGFSASSLGGAVQVQQPTSPGARPSRKIKDVGKKRFDAASLIKSLRRTSDDSSQSVDGRLAASATHRTSQSSSLSSTSERGESTFPGKPAAVTARSISLPEPDIPHSPLYKTKAKSSLRPEVLQESFKEEEEDYNEKAISQSPCSNASTSHEVEDVVQLKDGSSESPRLQHRKLQAFADSSPGIVVPETRLSAPAADKLFPSTVAAPAAAAAPVEAEDEFPISLVDEKDEEEATTTTVNDTLKVIFVGMAMVGKTSMIKRLINGKDAVVPTFDERTVGVDIYQWGPKNDTRFEDIDSRLAFDDEDLAAAVGDVDVKFSVWDFAGQHVYHATHELFFSPRALYVLVWDMGATNQDTHRLRRKAAIGINADTETGAFKLTYDSSDEEDDAADEPDFAEEEEARRADRALERDIDEKVQFWVDCIQSSVPGAAILPVASFSDYFEDDGGEAEAKRRCNMLKQRLLKHEERRLNGIKERLQELTDQKRANDIAAVRLRKLLCTYTRPKLIFGDGEDDSVVRVSGTKYTGFRELTQKIISIATGRERGRWRYPIFQGHVGAIIPRMRLQVRDEVREMRDRFKVVEWGYFINQLRGKGLTSVEDITDALFFLTNIGELSYFGGIEASGIGLSNPVGDANGVEVRCCAIYASFGPSFQYHLLIGSILPTYLCVTVAAI